MCTHHHTGVCAKLKQINNTTTTNLCVAVAQESVQICVLASGGIFGPQKTIKTFIIIGSALHTALACVRVAAARQFKFNQTH